MSQMIEMHSADHCVVVAELATSLKDIKFSKQRHDGNLDIILLTLEARIDVAPGINVASGKFDKNNQHCCLKCANLCSKI